MSLVNILDFILECVFFRPKLIESLTLKINHFVAEKLKNHFEEKNLKENIDRCRHIHIDLRTEFNSNFNHSDKSLSGKYEKTKLVFKIINNYKNLLFAQAKSIKMESSLEGEIESVIGNMAEELLKNERKTRIEDKPVRIKQVLYRQNRLQNIFKAFDDKILADISLIAKFLSPGT
ncbi:Oidioi.mRNA.OKI2018_I69.chr1.g559.t1.cds [Oikopleura dioica]|uniref:Oidioi.mRNA.OKI2018_I69.chr1.g559.t1.cds n=1 Tax=Oikopleura dioica TaxID=34765 RepID=A0ABN7SK86_OIKDI|nr:Oidioi.mRNA.OKI2018_I69.chr1.g559.t1.cds [Oikopleura dioica]